VVIRIFGASRSGYGGEEDLPAAFEDCRGRNLGRESPAARTERPESASLDPMPDECPMLHIHTHTLGVKRGLAAS
jgi:hypothetical protein